jgi:hypothetical protein
MTDRDAIVGTEHRWASRRALLERCPSCGEPRFLLPTNGRDGGVRRCIDCGQAVRRGVLAKDDRATLFDPDGSAR